MQYLSCSLIKSNTEVNAHTPADTKKQLLRFKMQEIILMERRNKKSNCGQFNS